MAIDTLSMVCRLPPDGHRRGDVSACGVGRSDGDATFWLTAARSTLASTSRRGSADQLAGNHAKRGVQVGNQVPSGRW